MIVKPEQYTHRTPFQFASGSVLPELEISYETYGKLNSCGDNAILICHYFSGHKHAAGFYEGETSAGWWDDLIGPDKAVDTSKYFVVCSDALSCLVDHERVKTSGPRSKNPATGQAYGMDFPVTTIEDMVRAQKLLLDHLKIKHLHAILGPSMGGLQALGWARLYPDFVSKIVCVAAAPKLDGFVTFFPLRMGIEAIQNDPHFARGQYYNNKERPLNGLRSAVSGLALIARGRNWCDSLLGGRNFDSEANPLLAINNMFQSEKSILTEVANRASVCDANSYIYISKANILFDFFSGYPREADLLQTLQSDFLCIADKNDIFVPPAATYEFFTKIKAFRNRSHYFEFTSPLAHLGSVTHSRLFSEEVGLFLAE